MTTTDTAYRWDHLSTDDVQAWAQLVNLLAEVDQTDEFLGPEDLAEELHEHGVDPARDTWAVWDGDALVGCGQVRVSHTLDTEGRVRIWLSGGVHPAHRGRAIGRRLIGESEIRGVELAEQRHPGRGAFWRADGNVEGASVRPMLEHRGYATVRYFNQMSRPIPGEPVSADAVPGDGVVLAARGRSTRSRCGRRTTWPSATTGARRRRRLSPGTTTGPCRARRAATTRSSCTWTRPARRGRPASTSGSASAWTRRSLPTSARSAGRPDLRTALGRPSLEA